jgi:hypothetical protein
MARVYFTLLTELSRRDPSDSALSPTRMTRMPPKKGLQVKKSTVTLGANGAAATRKRPALGDVSNVTKTDAIGAGAKDGKKPMTTKIGAVAKASQPTKVLKASRIASSHSILGTKDKKSAASSELKRPLSGSGIAGQPAKKRNNTSAGSKKEEDLDEAENVMPPQNAVVEADVVKTKTKVEVVEEVQKPITENWLDLDKEDVDDPLMVSEYVVEIFEYLKELEISTMANPDYMDSQNELEWKMRGGYSRFTPASASFPRPSSSRSTSSIASSPPRSSSLTASSWSVSPPCSSPPSTRRSFLPTCKTSATLPMMASLRMRFSVLSASSSLL